MTVSYNEYDDLKRIGKIFDFSFENIKYDDKISVEIKLL